MLLLSCWHSFVSKRNCTFSQEAGGFSEYKNQSNVVEAITFIQRHLSAIFYDYPLPFIKILHFQGYQLIQGTNASILIQKSKTAYKNNQKYNLVVNDRSMVSLKEILPPPPQKKKINCLCTEVTEKRHFFYLCQMVRIILSHSGVFGSDRPVFGFNRSSWIWLLRNLQLSKII